MADYKKFLSEAAPATEISTEVILHTKSQRPSLSSDIIARPSPLSTQPLVEPLTNRELDVLELLAQRLQNKEIAEKLFISDETVKGHLKNIYQKLNVNKRRQAVEKAKALGILSRQ